MGSGDDCVLDPALRVRGIENLRVVTVRRLAGKVYGGYEKLPGAELPGTTIELCATGWKQCIVGATCDSDGKFVLRPRRPKAIYYLRFSQSAYHRVLLRVRVSSNARHDLAISLPFAT